MSVRHRMIALRSKVPVGGFVSAVAALLVACSNAGTPPPTSPAPAASPARTSPPATASAETPEPGAQPEPIEAREVDSSDSEAGQFAWLGVLLKAPEEAHHAGVLIERVEPGSPAASAGLRAGDRLVQIDGEAVATPDDVRELVRAAGTGARLSLGVLREDKHRLMAAHLASYPGNDVLMRRRYVGNPAPAWRGLVPVNGTLAPELGAASGRVVVMEFWATWCVACRAMTPTLSRWHDQYMAQGVSVVGVTMDPPVDAAQAATSWEIDHSVFSDPDGETTLAYSARALPTVFVIDQQGVVRDVMIGYQSEHLERMEDLLVSLLRSRVQ